MVIILDDFHIIIFIRDLRIILYDMVNLFIYKPYLTLIRVPGYELVKTLACLWLVHPDFLVNIFKFKFINNIF